MKKITFSTLAFLGLLINNNLDAQTSRVQIIHNSADAAAEIVDIYAGTDLLIDDFEFRTATSFLDLPADVSINIGIAPSTSSSSTEAIATIPVTFNSGDTYVVVANGLISPSGYSPDAASAPFNLYAINYGREESSVMGNTDVLVFHGATDAPTIDVQAVGAGTVIDNLSWSEFEGNYLELPNANYTLNITDETGSTVVKSYQAPLETLGLSDSALVVLASGFLDPSVNSDGPEFGLWVALPEGGDLIPLPESTSRLQVIHNSADVLAASVDIYLNDALLLDNFDFRTASPFIDAPAEIEHTIAIAPSTSTDVSDAVVTVPVTFSANETYIAIANGILSPTGYSPATPFSLDIFDLGREASSTTGNTDVLVFHGSTDAPMVDVDEAAAGNLVNDITYGEFDGYLELPTADYILQVKDAAGSSVLFSYGAPLASLSLENTAIVVVASGFVNPSVNNDGAEFGLWVALPSGGALVALPTAFANVNNYGREFSVFPNPTESNFTINGINNKANIEIWTLDGKLITSQQILSNESVNTDFLESGMYILKVKEEMFEQTIKFTVK